MGTYAIHDGKTVLNVIVSDTLDIAESTTGMNAILTFGEPWIGWTLESDGWRPPSPYPSWIWSGADWQAPTPMPETGGPWVWNEDILAWEELI